MDMIAPVDNILYRHFGRHTQCMWTHIHWHWIHTQQLLHSVYITGGSGHERTPQFVDKPPQSGPYHTPAQYGNNLKH